MYTFIGPYVSGFRGRGISDFATRNSQFCYTEFPILQFLDFVTKILLCPPKIPPLVVVAMPLNYIVQS